MADAPFWSEPAAGLLAKLGSAAGGLSSAEARRRLRAGGPNTVRQEARSTVPLLLARQFASPLVLILLAGAALSAVTREWVDAAIIFAIVAGSASLGFWQEYRADAALAALRRQLALQARVLRDGVEATVPAASLVPGDVVRLAAGHVVPADGVVLEAADFLVSEASLTGESFPVPKRVGPVPPATPIAQRAGCVWLGTSVRSGTATMLVVANGDRTAYGTIAARVAARPPESAFNRSVREFGYLLMRTMVVMVLLVVAANRLLGRPAVESLLFAVALAVGLTPELLPAIVSVTVARGARDMAARGVVVRRLEAIEDIGSIDVLCTDKTGTLTEGVVTLQAAVDVDGRPAAGVLRLAFLNAALETGIANPLDAAIARAGQDAGCSLADVRKVDEIPYDFTRKRLTVVVREAGAGEDTIVTKGAVRSVLAACTPDAATIEKAERFDREMSEAGCRVLAVALRRCAPQPRYTHDAERDLSLAGFLVFLDAPKPGVARTLAGLARLGIRTKVITGDNRFVASHVARAVGLQPHAMLTGEQLARLKDEALWSLAPRTDLFVEVDPQQKERIVRALQRTGHVVGYLGDGINDAPALRAAHVGISVQGATDAARESADVVLLRRDLGVLRRGVEDGRATFANTQKYIGITTSANFGNMISMAVATPLLPFLPLAAKQILLNNFLSDLPAMAVATDRVEPQQLLRPQRWDVAALRRFMLVFGLLSTVFDLLTFALLLLVFEAGPAQFQTAWFVVSLLTEIAVLFVLRTQGPPWRGGASPLLVATSVLAAAAAFVLPHAGPLAQLFSLVPLPAPLWGVVIGVVLANAGATELAKRAFRGDGRRPGPDGVREAAVPREHSQA